MPIRVDPENNETRALFALIDLSGQRVLEIGCGDGRLTWRYAYMTAHVTAIEPFAPSVARAQARIPRELKRRVKLHQAAFEDFAADTEAEAFDVAILSWSLC